MPPPVTANEFLDLVRKSGVLDEAKYNELVPDDSELPADVRDCAARLVRLELLTPFQASQILSGKTRGFRLGPYRILKPLGQGGMGVVYLGEHLELNRKVALKILQTDKVMDKLTLERFLREARAVAALDHPNIVRIHDVSQQGQVRFLAMEYVDGETLESILHKGGAMSPSRAVDYITQAAVGLQHAHEKGFVHRDIKPGNLMLTRDGTIKILDMGLARSIADPKDRLTEVLDEGSVVGTVDFIAPEQAMNAPVIDIRADIYSLGATFYTLVTGKAPFQGTTQQKLLQHQMKPAPSLSEIDKTFPAELAEVVTKMLQKKPEDRYQTPADVVAALAAWLPDAGTARVVAGLSGTDLAQTEKMQATLTGLVASSAKRPKSKKRKGDNQWKWWAAGGGIAATLLVVVLIVVLGGGKKKPPDTAGPPPAPPAGPPGGGPKGGNPLPPSVMPKPVTGYERSQDPAGGLVGHWKFNTPVTKDAKDESGLGQTAVIDGTIDWSRADGRGALRFDAGLGMVRVPDHPRLRFRRGESFTLMTWVKPPPELVNGRWQGVVTKPRGRQDNWYGIWLGNINGERRWVYGSTFRADNMANLIGSAVVDDWQHVCIVQNSELGTRRIYVDGVDVTLNGAPGPAKDSDGIGDLLIGGATILEANNTETIEQFRGAIAEVRLYSKALPPEEIVKLAKPGK